MKKKFNYVGIFIPAEEVYAATENVGARLQKRIQHPHITFAYRPEEVDESLFGEEVTIRVFAYGSDAQNEGVKVDICTDNAKIQEAFGKIEVPHITLSISEDGKAVNTRFLDFKNIEPFTLKGRFGGYMFDGTVVAS